MNKRIQEGKDLIRETELAIDFALDDWQKADAAKKVELEKCIVRTFAALEAVRAKVAKMEKEHNG